MGVAPLKVRELELIHCSGDRESRREINGRKVSARKRSYDMAFKLKVVACAEVESNRGAARRSEWMRNG